MLFSIMNIFIFLDTDEITVAKIGGTGGSESISRVSVSVLALLLSVVLFVYH